MKSVRSILDLSFSYTNTEIKAVEEIARVDTVKMRAESWGENIRYPEK